MSKELNPPAIKLLLDVRNYGGLEVHKDELDDPAWKELLASGHVDQGPFRGPGKAWCRVVMKGEPIT